MGSHPKLDILGLCYRQHPDSPLETRIRFRLPDGEKLIVECDKIATPGEAVGLFHSPSLVLGNLGFFGAGRIDMSILSPNIRRSEYVAYCQMVHIMPLPAEGGKQGEN